MKGNRQGSLSRSITRRSDQNRKIKCCFYFAILPQLVKKVRSDFFDKLSGRGFAPPADVHSANKLHGQLSGGGQVTSMGFPVTGWVSARRCDHRAGEQGALLP